MPKAAFYLMWNHIKNNRNITAVIKNMAKNGDHYWVVTDFEIQTIDATGQIIGYIAYRQAAPNKVVKVIEPLYKTLLEIEKEYDMEASVNYLQGYLEERGMNYDQFIENLAKPKGIG